MKTSQKAKKAQPTGPEVTETAAINAAVNTGSVLVLTGLGIMWESTHVGQALQPVLALGILAYFLALMTVIDIRHGILPHMLTWPLLGLGVLLAPSLGHSHFTAFLGAVVAFGGILICDFLTRLLSGKDALGGGDVWLVVAVGAWVTPMGLPMFLVMAALLGGVSIGLKRYLTAGYPVFTQHEVQRFAFGPALCAAGWLAVLYGDAYWRAIDMLTRSAG